MSPRPIRIARRTAWSTSTAPGPSTRRARTSNLGRGPQGPPGRPANTLDLPRVKRDRNHGNYRKCEDVPQMTRPLAPVVVVLTLALAWPPAPASSTPEDDLAKAVDAYSQGRLPQARALLDSLTRDPGPMGGRAAYLLGVIDLQQEKFTWAMTAFEQAAAKLPVLADHAIYYRAVAAFHAGDYARAGDGFQALLIRYPTTSLRAAALVWKAER